MAKLWAEKLREIMKERGLSAKALSLSAGLNETYVWDLFNRNVDPTVSKITALSDALGLPTSYFFDGHEPHFPTIRVLGFAAGGEEWTPIDDNEELPQVDFVNLDLGDSDPIAIRVRGHSMSPVFRDGDDLICSRQRGIDIGRAVGHDCVVKTMTNRFYVKHLLKGATKNSYRLRSYNPSFPDVDGVSLEWAAPVIWIKRRN